MSASIYTKIKKRRITGLLFLLLLTGGMLNAQSNACADAVPITVQSSYVPQSYDITAFTNDGPALYSGTSFRDGWYSFTTGSTATAVLITAIGDAAPPIAISTYLSCSDVTAQASLVPTSNSVALYAAVSPNTTYLLRLSRTNNSASGSTGMICVQQINAIVSTYTAGDLNTEYAASEPDASSTSSCAGTMNITIPGGNAITTVSTLYHMRAYTGGLMEQQRSILSSPTLSAHEGAVAVGSGNAASTYKYERHNLTFAEGATGTIAFNLNAWRTTQSGSCNITYNKVTNYTWTVVAFYATAASCSSPSLNSFQTISYNTTTASISWDAPVTPPADGYEYVVSTNNNTPSGSGTHLASGTQVNLNSLTTGTNYYLFVRGRCDVSTFGNWAGPYPFNTAVCLPTAQCAYQLHMNNTTPSGWNGTIIGFRQNGVLVHTATLNSGSSDIASIPLCDNLSTEVFVQTLGSYSDEISFVLYDAAGNIEHTRNSGSALVLNNVLDSFTSSCPDCQSPSGLQASHPSSASLNIQWVAPITAPSNGYEYVVSTSSSFPSGAGTEVPTGTSVVATGLSSSTAYYVFVRSVCAPSVTSAWAGPLSVTTSCPESTLSISEGLNSGVLNCWEMSVVTDQTVQSGIAPELTYVTNSNNPSGLSAHEGSGFLRFNSYNCDSGDQIRLISTPFETTGLSSVDVEFVWSHDPDFASSNDGLQVQYSFDKENWVNAGAFTSRFSSGHVGWNLQSVSLPAAVLEQPHVYVALLFTSDGGNDCYIDNVIVRESPACKKPTGVKATHLTNTFCRIDWTGSVSAPSNGYTWELRTSGTAGSGAIGLVSSGNVLSGTNYVEIASLNELTTYTFFVKSNCADEDSEWTWPYQFRTVAGVINTFPFDENYEASSSTRPGWQNEYSFGNLNWTYAAGAGSGDVTTAHTGSSNARFRSTTDITYRTKLVSPPLNLASLPSGARLKFWYANQSWSGRQNELRVFYKTTYGDEWSLIPTATYTVSQSTWTEVTLTLPESGTDYYIAFEGLNKNSRGIALDDVRIEPIECPIPTPEAIAGQNSAFIHWSIAGDASNKIFEWEVRTAGEPGSGAIGLKSSGVTAAGVLGRNVGGLTANTTYHLYVRTRCAVDDYSLWSSAHTFTTTTIAPPINDQFTSSTSLNAANYIYPNCLAVNGTTVGATPYFHQDYNDVWYSFTALSNGTSIRLMNASFDGAIILMDAGMNILSTENITGSNQEEILNAENLIAGQTYYIAIANYMPSATADGTFSLCLKRLKAAWVQGGEYNLCSALKSQPVGPANYTFIFTPTGSTPGSVTSASSSTGVITLSLPQLNLRWGGTYSVRVDATFSLQNGLGSTEYVTVPGVIINNISIPNAPLVQLNPSQNCNNTTLYRSSLILPYGTTQSYVCGVLNYTAEFTRVADCDGNNPDNGSTFSVSTSTTSNYLSLSYVFNTGGVPASSAHAGYWRVRWRPNFTYGSGNFGPAQIMRVYNTSNSPQGMTLQPSNELLSDVNTSIVTSIYPNPNDGSTVNINISGIDGTTGLMTIIDPLGRVIHTEQITLFNNFNSIVSFEKALPAGMYFVDYNFNGQTKRDKLLVIR